MNAPAYKLTVNNQSTSEGYVLIFLEKPDASQPDMQTFAWQSKFLYSDVEADFSWELDWGFIWQQTNAVNASQQIVPADLQTKNQITLSYDASHQAFHFSKLTQGASAGQLRIVEDSSVPIGMVDVGVALSGHPAFMVKSQPNMTVAITPKPSYWLAFGNSESKGPINVGEYTNAVKLQFPPNIYALTATIHPDKSITIENTPLLVAKQPDL